MCRKGPVSSSSTGLTPKTFVYHSSLAARSVTVTATWLMAGIVVTLATLVSCLIMAIVQGELLTARLVREGVGVGVGVGAEAAVEVAVAPLARAVLGRADHAFEGEP